MFVVLYVCVCVPIRKLMHSSKTRSVHSKNGYVYSVMSAALLLLLLLSLLLLLLLLTSTRVFCLFGCLLFVRYHITSDHCCLFDMMTYDLPLRPYVFVVSCVCVTVKIKYDIYLSIILSVRQTFVEHYLT